MRNLDRGASNSISLLIVATTSLIVSIAFIACIINTLEPIHVSPTLLLNNSTNITQRFTLNHPKSPCNNATSSNTISFQPTIRNKKTTILDKNQVHNLNNISHSVNPSEFHGQHKNNEMKTDRRLAPRKALQSPTNRPTSENQKSVQFLYALEFSLVDIPKSPVVILSSMVETIQFQISMFLHNIGYVPSFSSSPRKPGTCKLENKDTFCTLVEVYAEVTSISRRVTEEEVIGNIKLYMGKMKVVDQNYYVGGKLSYAIETEFTYYYSTTDPMAPFFTYDAKIMNAVKNEGYEVLSFETFLDRFLDHSFMPKDNTCHENHKECTLNTGVISVVEKGYISDEEEKIKLLRIIHEYMVDSIGNQISTLTYLTPILPEIGVPSTFPSLRPVVSPSASPSFTPSRIYTSTIRFTYALEYTYNGYPPEILSILIRGVEAKVIEFIQGVGYKSKVVSSKPKSRDLPGSCKIADKDVYCALVEAVIEVTSTTSQVSNDDIIYAIKPNIEVLVFTDKNAGLDGKLSFITQIEFTYFYSTKDPRFPFFSFDSIILKAIVDQDLEALAYTSELVYFLGDTFWPKGSRCHPDYVECTLNKGILTIPLPDKGDEGDVEEIFLRAAMSYMKGTSVDDVSMLTYKDPKFDDPTSSPTIKPTNPPTTRAPTNFPTTRFPSPIPTNLPSQLPSNIPTKERTISISYDYALESKSATLKQSLGTLLAPSIEFINTQILNYLSEFVSCRGMSSKLFKECKSDNNDVFCTMITSDIVVAYDSSLSPALLRKKTLDAWAAFVHDKTIVTNRGIVIRLFAFFNFDFTFTFSEQSRKIPSYTESDREITSVLRNENQFEVIIVECKELAILVGIEMRQALCTNDAAFCAKRKCEVFAHSKPQQQTASKMQILLYMRNYMKRREDKEIILVYSDPELPKATTNAPSKNPTHNPSKIPSSFPTKAPSFPLSRMPSKAISVTSSESPTLSSHEKFILTNTTSPHKISTSHPTFKNNMVKESKKLPLSKLSNSPSVIPLIVESNTVKNDSSTKFSPFGGDGSFEMGRRTAHFMMHMHGNFRDNPEDQIRDEFFCPLCMYIGIAKNVIKNGLTDYFQDRPLFYSPDNILEPAITEVNSIFNGTCGTGCAILNCSVMFENVDDATSPEIYLEILRGAEEYCNAELDKVVPGQNLRYVFAGPTAITAYMNINLVGVASLSKMANDTMTTFENTTLDFFSKLLDVKNLPYRVMKVEVLKQIIYTHNRASAELRIGNDDRGVRYDEMTGSHPSLLLELKFKGLFDGMPSKNNFITVINDLFDQNNQDFVSALQQSNDNSLQMLIDIGSNLSEEEISLKHKIHNPDEKPEPEEEELSEMGVVSKPSGKKSVVFADFAIPIAIITCGAIIITFHMRGTRIETEEILDAEEFIRGTRY